MKILLDSNVMIAAYPVTGEADEYSPEAARRLLRLANEHGHTTFRHPASLAWDFDNVRDRKVREWRKNTASVIPELQDPPAIQPEIVHCAGRPARGTSDWVDQHMLAAVVGDAVDILVTEDRGILRTASCLELGERVVPIDDALAAISARAPRPPDVALLPRYASAYELNETDPIFESLREDYPGFDDWLRKCKREHRRCWTLRRNGSLAALAIVKDNEDPAELVSEEIPLDTKLLKVSTFKVAADSPGLRYGELLLKSVFAYAYENSYEYAYVTTLPKHQNVVSFLEQFGFRRIDTRTTLGEIVMLKALQPRAEQHPADDLAYHLEFGPLHYRLDVDRFLIPIAPRYHTLLFPEADDQQQLPGLATSAAAGNGILKAYLSRSGTRSIRPGAILYFYRSTTDAPSE